MEEHYRDDAIDLGIGIARNVAGELCRPGVSMISASDDLIKGP